LGVPKVSFRPTVKPYLVPARPLRQTPLGPEVLDNVVNP